MVGLIRWILPPQGNTLNKGAGGTIHVCSNRSSLSKLSVPLTREGLDFLSETRSRLSTSTGDARETIFLFQSLSATIQRINAVAFQGTMSRLSGNNDQRPWSQDRSNHNVNVEYYLFVHLKE